MYSLRCHIDDPGHFDKNIRIDSAAMSEFPHLSVQGTGCIMDLCACYIHQKLHLTINVLASQSELLPSISSPLFATTHKHQPTTPTSSLPLRQLTEINNFILFLFTSFLCLLVSLQDQHASSFLFSYSALQRP